MIESDKEKLFRGVPNPDKILFENNAFGDLGPIQKRFANLSDMMEGKASPADVQSLIDLSRKLYIANKDPNSSTGILEEIEQKLSEIEKRFRS